MKSADAGKKPVVLVQMEFDFSDGGKEDGK